MREDTQLIYVDAGNNNGNDIRNVFANMDFTNDTETIALIAGGHTFCKCHSDRSGFEGAWIFTPTQWSVSYIENLLDLDWFESDTPSGSAKQINNTGNTLMMLVADIALKEDADHLAALNTYWDDSDLLKTCSSIYIYIYIYIFIVELDMATIFSRVEKFKNSPLG